METKQWWKSTTMRSLIVAAVGMLAPKYAPLADLVGPALGLIGQSVALGGLAGAAYGRVKAKTKLTAKKPKAGN